MEFIQAKDDFNVPSSVRFSETPDGAILLDVEQGLCFSMNAVGVFIWTRLNRGVKVNDISFQLARTFDISVEHATNDVNEFLRCLQQKRLLQGQGSKEGPSRERDGGGALLSRLWRQARRKRAIQEGK